MQAPASIRVGIIGAGLSATTFHAPFIAAHPSLHLTKFMRSSLAPVPGYESLPVAIDLESFLTSAPAIDLAVITTPTHTHAALAQACLAAGKHVVLEKPAAATGAEAAELARAARAAGRLLAVYQNRRWDGDFLTVAALIKSGALGRVVEFESHFDRFRNSVKPGWKEDGDLPGAGILHDLGAHLVDQALTLFGRPAALTASLLNQRQLPATTVPDAFTLQLHYTSAAGPLTVILRASMLAKLPGPRFAVHGTAGSYIKAGMDVQEGQLRAGMSPADAGFGVEPASSGGVLDSIALDMDTLGISAAAAAGSSLPALLGSNPEAADALGLPAADVAAVAAAVLARKDASSTSGSVDGCRIRVTSETGWWMAFYDDVAGVLLGEQAQSSAAAAGSIAPAAAGPVEAAAAVASAVGGASGGSGAGGGGRSGGSTGGGINSRLAVQPEQAAAVIELLELAVQSSKEGRTISLDP